jgi:hypothetical protein
MSSEPSDKALYNKVKKMADRKFASKTGIYKSSWIVKKYKSLGGKYQGKKSKSSGLSRWFKEKWVDLNRPISNKSGKIIGYKSCGRKSALKSPGKYPLCRPSKKISFKTPKTIKEINKKSITKAKKEKARVKGSKNIKFGGKTGEPKVKLNVLPDDIVIEIISSMDIKEIYKFCSLDKSIYNICKKYWKTILINLFKRKNYTKALFIIDDKLLTAFYKIDPKLENTPYNIVRAYSLHKNYDIYWILTKFLLLNRVVTNTSQDAFDNYTNRYSDYRMARNLVLDQYKKSINTKSKNDILVLCELIKYSFTSQNEYISDDTLEYLKIKSKFKLPDNRYKLKDDWRDCLRKEINAKTNSNFSLYISNHLAYLISRKSKNWDAYLYEEGQSEDESEDESDPNQNYIYRTLFFNCMEEFSLTR